MRVSESVTVPNDLRPQVILTHCRLPVGRLGSLGDLKSLTQGHQNSQGLILQNAVKYCFPDAAGQQSPGYGFSQQPVLFYEPHYNCN